MHTHTVRTQAWLADLASIQAEISAHGMPAPAPRVARKRARKLKPLWEEGAENGAAFGPLKYPR